MKKRYTSVVLLMVFLVISLLASISAYAVGISVSASVKPWYSLQRSGNILLLNSSFEYQRRGNTILRGTRCVSSEDASAMVLPLLTSLEPVALDELLWMQASPSA